MSATQLRALAGTSPLRRRRLGPHVTITRPRPSPTAGESLLASSTRTSGPNSSPTPDADEVQGASSPGVPRRWRSAGWAPGRARRSEAPDRVRRFCSAYSSSPGLSVAGGRGRTGGTPPRQPPPGSPCGEKLLEPSTRRRCSRGEAAAVAEQRGAGNDGAGGGVVDPVVAPGRGLAAGGDRALVRASQELGESPAAAGRGAGGRGAGGRAAGARVGGGRARAVPVAARQPGGGGGGGGTARADEPADRAPGGRVAVHGRSYDASGGAGRADTTRSELPARTERPAAARGRRAHPCRSRAAAAGVRAPASAPARALAGEPRRRGGDPPARGARGSAAGAGRAGRHAGACHENRRRAWISIA